MTWIAALAACGTGASDGSVPDAAGDAAVGEITWHTPIGGLAGALLGVWGRGSDEIWAVGVDAGDGTGPIVIRGSAADGWRRLDVRPVDPEGGHLWWVFGPDGSATWMVGERGRVLRVVGEAIERVESGTDATLYGIWGASEAELWAVGGYVYPRSGPPTIVRVTPGGAEVVALPEASADEVSGTFFKVWGSRADDVWVVGEKGMALHYDGTAWRRVAIAGSPRLVTVHGGGAEQVIAVGGSSHGVIYERVGESWGAVPLEGVSPLNGVFVEPSGEAWAVGMLGQVLHRAIGASAWEPVQAESLRRDWHAVWVDGRGDVWVAGGDLLTRLDQGTLARRGPVRDDLPNGEVLGLDPARAEAEADTVEVSEPDAAEVEEILGDSAAPLDGAADGEIVDVDGVADGGPEVEDAASDADADGDDAFELGAIEDGVGFVPIVDGGRVALEHGPQGGFHLVVVARFAWPSSDPELPIGLAMQLEVEGTIVAASYPVTSYPAQRVAEGVYQTYELLVMFCEDPPPGDCFAPMSDSDRFDGKRARLSAEIAPPGTTWRRTIEVVLADTL